MSSSLMVSTVLFERQNGVFVVTHFVPSIPSAPELLAGAAAASPGVVREFLRDRRIRNASCPVSPPQSQILGEGMTK